LTGLCKAFFYTPAGPLNWGDIQVVDNRLIIAWYISKEAYGGGGNGAYSQEYGTIYIWDTKKEKQPQKMDMGLNYSIISLRISGDGSKVFLLDWMDLKALSTQTGEVVGEVGTPAGQPKPPLIMDGSRVWVQTKHSPIQRWDFGILGSTPIPLSSEPPGPNRPHLSFTHGAKGWKTGLSWIKDTVTGKVVCWLPKRYGKPTAAQWDGQYLVAGYKSGEVLILDFNHMAPQQTCNVNAL